MASPRHASVRETLIETMAPHISSQGGRGAIEYVLCANAAEVSRLCGLQLGAGTSVTDVSGPTIVTTLESDLHEISHAVALEVLHGFPPALVREGLAGCFLVPTGWLDYRADPERGISIFDDLSSVGFYRATHPWAQAGALAKFIWSVAGREGVSRLHEEATVDNLLALLDHTLCCERAAWRRNLLEWVRSHRSGGYPFDLATL
jgi:hypothetical protein